jgi:hypothetical protein
MAPVFRCHTTFSNLLSHFSHGCWHCFYLALQNALLCVLAADPPPAFPSFSRFPAACLSALGCGVWWVAEAAMSENLRFCDIAAMAKPGAKDALTASQQLELLIGFSWPYAGRPPRYDLSTWTVTDDWPDPVPVTLGEVELFERWFGDLFDELFGGCS